MANFTLNKKIIYFYLLIIFLTTFINCLTIWPRPQTLTTGIQTVQLFPNSFQFIQVNGNSDLLSTAFKRYFPLVFYNATKTDKPNSSTSSSAASIPELKFLNVYVDSNDETLELNIDESYSLDISTNSNATLTAKTVFGALHGLETFSQLVDFTAINGIGFLIQNIPISIDDAPRFVHRGLMIDSSRHFIPLSLIFSTVDALAYNKLNVLHWHIVDGESFPVECKSYPKLSLGAWTPNRLYTQDEISQVVNYAYQRGIRVIVEFDTPGHAYAWGIGYPELIVRCPSYWYLRDNVPLDPTNDFTYEVIDGLFKEMTQVFTDQYFHIGGDEVVYGCWQQSAEISTWMQQHGYTNYDQLMQYYQSKLWLIVDKYGKDMIAWQEVFDSYGIKSLPSSMIIEVWKDQATLQSVASAGVRGLLAFGWYLNYLTLTWFDFYTNEPFPDNSGWTPTMENYIIGGEACLWAEYTNAANFEQKIWPRASAAAERLWSPRYVNDPIIALPRLIEMSCRLNRRGIASSPLQPGYCIL
eukprot:TRINITY_DN2685_c1_g3_i1.p1 TRINITY_DN2685_c1_g3~~TRINITY_DN2685_c1_g3_i1.p1  ORF type:complete len:525 (+),score=222.79 TRINITY_DN2685_c1_g3_i1:63-1637(+)